MKSLPLAFSQMRPLHANPALFFDLNSKVPKQFLEKGFLIGAIATCLAEQFIRVQKDIAKATIFAHKARNETYNGWNDNIEQQLRSDSYNTNMSRLYQGKEVTLLEKDIEFIADHIVEELKREGTIVSRDKFIPKAGWNQVSKEYPRYMDGLTYITQIQQQNGFLPNKGTT